jgi:hypothetical protein
MKLITNAIVTKFTEYFSLWDILPSSSIGIFILQVLSLHNQVKLPCDNFNKYGSD